MCLSSTPPQTEQSPALAGDCSVLLTVQLLRHLPPTDVMQEWFEQGAADGFNVLSPILPSGFTNFADLVVPELQKRGLFRTEYEGTTLRDNLGLTRQRSCYE